MFLFHLCCSSAFTNVYLPNFLFCSHYVFFYSVCLDLLLFNSYCLILSLAAHPSKGGLQTVYNRLQVPSPSGPIVPCANQFPMSLGRSCLCNSTRGDLAVSRTETSTYGPRNYAVLGPISWNLLPQSFSDTPLTLGRFQHRLKTSLFCMAHGRDLTAHS